MNQCADFNCNLQDYVNCPQNVKKNLKNTSTELTQKLINILNLDRHSFETKMLLMQNDKKFFCKISFLNLDTNYKISLS